MSQKQVSATAVESDHDYYGLERLVAQRVVAVQGSLFTTDATGLFDAYLEALPEASRQHYRCRACQRFLEKYGGLATIGDDGRLTVALWGLAAGAWVEVACICLAPPHWRDPERFQHVNPMAHFVLEGARDLRHVKGGCFFPEQLRSEFHGVRSVMEAYAQEATIAGRDEGDANGLAFQKGSPYELLVRVQTASGMASYRLDRWD